jgi:IS5 family transposase
LASTTTKANCSDIDSALNTVDQIKIGNRLRRPKRVGADKGYDCIELRIELRKRGIKPAVRHRKFKNRRDPEKLWNDSGEIRYARKRWCVEQRFACLDQSRRIDFMYERTRDQYEAFLVLACIRCYLKRLTE